MNIYGAGGHAKVILGISKTRGLSIDFIVDDDPDLHDFMGHEVRHEITEEVIEIPTIFAIGKNETRKKVSEGFQGKIHDYISHSSAVISPTVVIGEGTVIMANAVINGDAQIGKHCIINTNAVVEHDNVIEDYVHISPSASLAGNVKVEEGAWVGIGSSVREGVNIGKWSVVGAGAVVLNDVPDYAIVVGNPASLLEKGED